jgi:hypothetical protein
MGESLFDKTKGPNAIPVYALLARAERALDTIKREYLPFLRSSLPEIDALYHAAAENAAEPSCWDQLRIAALDLRSSSATAGNEGVSAVASSLEWLLTEAVDGDQRITEVVSLHLDAIRLLVSDVAPTADSPAMRELLSQLGRASYRLRKTRRSAL